MHMFITNRRRNEGVNRINRSRGSVYQEVSKNDGLMKLKHSTQRTDKGTCKNYGTALQLRMREEDERSGKRWLTCQNQPGKRAFA